MKDKFGQELQVGDEVIVNNWGELIRGEIQKILASNERPESIARVYIPSESSVSYFYGRMISKVKP